MSLRDASATDRENDWQVALTTAGFIAKLKGAVAKTKEDRVTDEYCKCVLLTGGVGFVGSHIGERLLADGIAVVIYDIFNSETTKSAEKQENAALLYRAASEHAAKGAKLTIVNGDIRDQEHVMKVIQEHGVTGTRHKTVRTPPPLSTSCTS